MISLSPPSVVRGMKVLNKEIFCKNISVPALTINDLKLSVLVKCLKKYFLKLENFKPIQIEENADEQKESPGELRKSVYLNPHIVNSWADICQEHGEILAKSGITENSFGMKQITLNYENWRADEILKAVLPPDKETLTSYSNIGHIVHVNLKDHLTEYKQIIGQVLLDKIKGCETVINKTNSIDNTYRNFHMEILSGKADFQAKVKENNCTFEFDFSKVYWNPRLSTEHLRISNMLKTGNILFDVFAGVGPFAIPCAKKKCTVYANDLNPESFRWLVHNAKINKIKDNFFTAFNMDGKVFITDIVPKYLLEIYKAEKYDDSQDIHVTMNLPALAVEFLKYFKGILKNVEKRDLTNYKPPIIHVYCFVPGENSVTEAKKLVEENLQANLNENLIEIFNVRNVSPNKEMLRVSFHLPNEILFDSFPESNNSNKRKRANSDE